MTEQKELNIFISYSQKDRTKRISFYKALTSNLSQYNCNFWYDEKISAGHDIKKEVMKHLDASHIVILLISTNFLNSKNCIFEVTHAKKRSDEVDVPIIVPVILTKCQIDSVPSLSGLLKIPENGKPISSYSTPDVGYNAAANAIKKLIDKQFSGFKRPARSTKKKVNTSTSKTSKATSLSISLYKNGKPQPITINQDFLNTLPSFILDFKKYNDMMKQMTENRIKDFREHTENVSYDVLESLEMDELRLYLMDICGFIKKFITDTPGFRIHFRGLTNRQYVGIIACTDQDDSKDLQIDWSTELTPIPQDQGLIYHSAKLGGPLLKSLNKNKNFNFQSQHNEDWKEYSSYALCSLNEGKTPVISFGISIHKNNYNNHQRNLFLQMAYLKIAEITEEYIKEYCSECKKLVPVYDIETIIGNQLKAEVC